MVLIGANTGPAEQGIAKVAGMLSPGGALAVGAVAAAAVVAGIGVASIKMAGDFQAGMTSLVTGAGESKANLKLVSDGILQMAVDTGTSTDQLTSGMYMIESAGYHGKAGLDVLKAAAEGAKVGNADLGTVADATTTIMVDYADSHVSAAQAVNELVTTVASGKTHMQDLAGAMAQILPTAAAAHIGLNDVMGAMATMTGEGVPAANAATYLRQTIIALQAPSAGTVKALKEVGLNSTDIANKMKTDLPGALKDITDAVGKKFPEGSAQYVAAMKNIAGGSKQMQGILDLTGSHMATFKSNTESIGEAAKKNGNQIAGWNDVQGDFNQKMDRAGEVVKTYMIQLGEKLLPVAGRLADFFANNLPGALSAVGGAISNVVTIGAGIVKFFQDSGAGATTVKAILVVLGGAMLGFAASAIPAAVAGIMASVVAFGAQAIAAGAAAVAVIAATWPFILVGAAIAAVVVGIYMLITHWSQVQAFFGKVGQIVGQTVQNILHAVGQFFSNVGKTVQNGIAAVGQFVQDGVNTVVGWFSWLYNHNYFFKALVDEIKRQFTLAKEIVTTVWNAISGVFMAALNWIRNRVTTDWNALVFIFTTVGGAILGKVRELWGDVTGFIGGLASKIGAAVHDGVVTPITNEVSGIIKLAESWGSNLLKMFISGVSSQAGALKSAAGNVLGGLGKILGFHSPAEEGPGHDADTWAPNLMKMFISGVVAAAPEAVRAASGVMTGVAGVMTGQSGVGGLRVGALGAPNPAVAQLAISPAAQLAQSVSGIGVAGGSGATQQIIIQLDSRTIGQGAVQGMPSIVRVGTGGRGF